MKGWSVFMTLSEKASYLKGLMDGLKIDDSTDTGKILLAMGDLLNEMASTVDTIDADVDDIVDFCNVLDEDLHDIETALCDDDDECDCDCDCDDCCDCDCDDDDVYEVVCPSCSDTIELTYDMVLEGSINCPNCGEFLEFDLDEESDDEE